MHAPAIVRSSLCVALLTACADAPGTGGDSTTGLTTSDGATADPSMSGTAGTVTTSAGTSTTTSTTSATTEGGSSSTPSSTTSDATSGASSGSDTCPDSSTCSGGTTSDTTGADTCGWETTGGPPSCGDGVRDLVDDPNCSEQCDLGQDNNDGGPCTTQCRAAACGDGLLHVGVEDCDDGNDNPADGCANDCGNPFTYTPPKIVAGSTHMCALSPAGKVRCWGGSAKHGELGYGSTQQIGNAPGEMPPPDVNVGGTVVQLTAGDVHTCALLAGGTVRCWGYAAFGALGYGNTENIGDEPGEMPPPDVDVGGAVVQIAAGEFNTCALLKSGAVRCWGAHSPNSIGDGPGEMPPKDIPLAGKFVQIHGNRDQSCVLRENGTVACWGTDHAPYGVYFGGFVVEVSGEVCARLAGGAIRCTGYNDYGQKGYGHTESIGDAIKAGDIPVGGAVKRLVPGDAHTCAILNAGNVRCWGENSSGSLGYGHTDNLGDEPGEMPTPNLDLGGPALDLAVAYSYSCATFAGTKVRCWGLGKGGNLGYGNYQNIGDGPGEMPPPYVPVF